MFTALALISIPTFVTGPLLILIFAVRLGWLPVGGWASWPSIILPAITLAGPYMAYIARLMRSSLLEVLAQDFVRTARAKGLTESQAVYRHALKVAILPVVSFIGPLAASLLTGSLIVETLFNIPGAGPHYVNSILSEGPVPDDGHDHRVLRPARRFELRRGPRLYVARPPHPPA
jgi:oligopeptide transport system permease protein